MSYDSVSQASASILEGHAPPDLPADLPGGLCAGAVSAVSSSLPRTTLQNSESMATTAERMTVFAPGRKKTAETVKPQNQPTNADFMARVFHTLPDTASPLVVSFTGDPHKVKESAWQARPWPLDLSARANNYFALASFYPGDDGAIRRRKTHFAGLHAIMLDDLGTKASFDRLNDLPLSWLIETSPGNFQGGLILAEPIPEVAPADRLVKAIIGAGLCDPGAGGPTARVARLPVAINGKQDPPFSCVLHIWAPEVRYTPDDLVLALELDLAPAGRPKKEPGRRARAWSVPADDVHIPRPDANPVLVALQAKGLYKSPLGGGRHDLTCPWCSEHTDGIDSGTAYFEPDDGFPLGGFRCLHSHGERLHIRDLLQYLDVPLNTARMKPTIRVVAGEIHRVVDRAEAELTARGRHYQSGGLIVSVTTRPETRDPIIETTSAPALTRELAAATNWEKFDARSDDWVRCDPPARHVGILYDAQEYRHLKPLRGLARQPYYRADGHLVRTAGYDEQAQLFGVFDPREFPIPARASKADAEAALKRLEGLLTEFHFRDGHDKAAALSAMLTAAVRPSLPLAPMFHVRAHAISSGKSYLCKVITAFAGPGLASPSSYPSDGEEAGKALLALLLNAPAVVEFDDMTTDLIPFGTMNRCLTEENITERILGESKKASVSTRTLFLSSGNNVGPIRDMTRRVVTIHLDPKVETPALLTYNADPLGEVRAHRGRYVADALTIIEAWKQAGSPRADAPTVASYNGEWTSYCRMPLLWLGHLDPAHALIEQVKSDPDKDALASLLLLWHSRYQNEKKLVRDVLSDLRQIGENSPGQDLLDALREIAEDRGGEINRRRLGWWIQRHEGRIAAGLAFRREDMGGKRIAWYVDGTPRHDDENGTEEAF